MTKQRKSNKTRKPVIGLQAIPATVLKANINERSEAKRKDGKSGAGSTRPPRRRTHSAEPPGTSSLEWAGFIACLDDLWLIATNYERVLDASYYVGRKSECSVADILVFQVLMEVCRSSRGVQRFLNDFRTWNCIREEVENAWPDKIERRLSPFPPSRFQYMRLHNKLENLVPDFRNTHRELVKAANLRVAKVIGIGQATDSISHPSGRNILVGDATWERALFNGDNLERYVDRTTGEIFARRADPDALPYHQEGSGPGNYLVSAQMRTEYPRERLILDSQYKPDGVGDGTVFADMALSLFESVGIVRGVAYDMSLKSEDQDRIGSTGRHVLTHVPMTKKNQVRIENMGPLKFKRNERSFERDVIVIDGCPTIPMTDIEGTNYYVPLVRIQTKLREKTMYNIFEIPSQPVVTPSLRGAKAMIRCFSSPSEIEAGNRRSSFLRSIPLNDTDFDRLYGLREDTESMHNDLKSRRVGRRARSVGLARREFDARGYQLHQMATALLAWSERTGQSIEEFVGKWKPQRPAKVALAA